MTAPNPARLLEVLDATWPAARTQTVGLWCLRDGAGGGKRVSATTANGPVNTNDIASAEAGMAKMGQPSLFMIRHGENDLDAELASRGYDIVDPVTLYLAPVDTLTAALRPTDAMAAWPPLALQAEIWAGGGIGPARLAVMDRAPEPKTSLLGRSGDTPCGTGFVGAHDGIAMVHALEVHPDARRKGVGARLMRGAANWADALGIRWLALAVTRANAPANALYRALGMDEAAGYHYRLASGAST